MSNYYVLGYRFVKKSGLFGLGSDDRYKDKPCSDYSFAGLFRSYAEADNARLEKIASDKEQGWDTVYEIFSEEEWDNAHPKTVN